MYASASEEKETVRQRRKARRTYSWGTMETLNMLTDFAIYVQYDCMM